MSRMTPRRSLLLLIFATTAMRLPYAATLDLGHDEAYHLLYTRHLDWSQVDHPPAVGALAAAGLALEPWLGSLLAPRLPFILLFAGSTWLVTRLTARVYGIGSGLAAAFLLNAAGYFGLASAAFVLPDGPLLFFWLLALNAYVAALRSPDARHGGLRPWVVVGLAVGGAMLSKYHGVLLPVGLALHLAVEPAARAWLRRPGPYLALAISVALFSPVLGWNAAHEWVSFLYQSGRAMPGNWLPRPDLLATATLGQAVYVFPWVWLALIARLFRSRPVGTGDRFFRIQAVVPLVVVGLVACWRPTLPHWGLIGLVPLMAPAGDRLAHALVSAPSRTRRRLVAWGVAPAIAGALVVAHERRGLLPTSVQERLGATASSDPTIEPYGWGQVADALRASGVTGTDGSFVFTSQWYHSGQLARALGESVPVLCYSARKSVGFGVWSPPASWVGRDGILVVVEPRSTEPDAFARWFERIEPLGSVVVDRAGAVVRTVRLYRCVRQLMPFPYAQATLWDAAGPTLAAGSATSPGTLR